MDVNGSFIFLLLEVILADLSPQVDLPVDLNGSFTFLLSNVPFHRFLISRLSDKRSGISQMLQADQVADLPP